MTLDVLDDLFQYSSASRKFLNLGPWRADNNLFRVSVLFSEPKIPQSSNSPSTPRGTHKGFSTLQRAENSSMRLRNRLAIAREGFSTLQRAENSSIFPNVLLIPRTSRFQYSSASRKFLNPDPRTCVHPYSRLRRSRFVVPEPSWCVAMTPVY